MKRKIVLEFVSDVNAEPDRPGFDVEEYERCLLENVQLRALDIINQWLAEGQLPGFYLMREDGAIITLKDGVRCVESS